MDFSAELVDSVEASVGTGVEPRYMVTVVGERFTGGEARGLSHDFVAFDHQSRAIRMKDNPFATKQRDRAIRGIPNRDEVNEGVGLVCGQTRPTVMVMEFVEAGSKAD